MGSPLSPVIANILMEHFETTALQTLSQRPSLWLRYVDDTFVIWPHSRPDLDHFLAHINQHHPSIKFTMETEQNNSIPFLDVLVTKSPSGKPAHQVYRKPTHTDRYLHYRSFHHPSVLQSVPNALIRRAHQLSDADHLDQEIQHVTTALTSINYEYPRHKIKSKTPANKPAANSTPEENQPAATPPKQTIVLPYIGQASLTRFNVSFKQQTSKFDTVPPTNSIRYSTPTKTSIQTTRKLESTKYHANVEKSTLVKRGEIWKQDSRSTEPASDSAIGISPPSSNTPSNTNTPSNGITVILSP
ncbi:uncharacterized protein LOC115921322 [Strongylocentrotus purpuratus]|uniref:Reverse transcriptase domain-containing protein n=1 Tax=Strongylocentrotus purpuratus TaxID=7668 RepID=A0A7M7NCQ7_STRPU|nr:uncharacterized protein LOC115921322 [Strongylocentrotus purpuratus]